MPQGQVIMYKPPEDRQLQRTMFIEKMGQQMGQAIAGLGGIAQNYVAAKQAKTNQDIANIAAAGAMVGGIDKLPQDTINKIPGIYGVDMPRDENGNVQITPTLHDMMNRTATAYLAKNPDAAGAILAGVQNKATDPASIAAERERTDAQIRIAAMEDETKRLSIDSEFQKAKEANAAAYERQQLINDGAMARTMSKKDHENYMAQPGPLVIDNQTGETFTEKAARTKLQPGEDFDTRFTSGIARRDMQQYLQSQRDHADFAYKQTQTDIAKKRYELSDLKTKSSINKDNLTEINGYAKGYAQAKAAGNTDAMGYFDKAMKDFYKKNGYANDPGFLEQHWDRIKSYTYGVLEAWTGQHIDINMPPPEGPPLAGTTTSTGTGTSASTTTSSGPASRKATVVVKKPGASAVPTPYSNDSNDADMRKLSILKE
jgi:hypothetical protein